MNPLSRQALHATLLWRDHKGRYEPRLAADCRRLLAASTPLSAGWIDALRTLRKLDPEAGDILAVAAGQPLHSTSPARLAFLLAFLLESGQLAPAIAYFEPNRRRLAGLIEQNPALCWLAHRDRPDAQQPPLARLLRQAAQNREAFAAWVTDPGHRIVVLGNGPIERPPQLADDANTLIIDFNHPAHALPLPARARHAWVRTPNTSVTARDDQALSWVIFSGNNSLYQRLRLSPLLPADFTPAKYLFAPSPIWWELVDALAAPPSAGLLMLHWIASLRGTLAGVEVHGCSIMPGAHPLNRKPGRHHWQRERAFLQRWSTGDSA